MENLATNFVGHKWFTYFIELKSEINQQITGGFTAFFYIFLTFIKGAV